MATFKAGELVVGESGCLACHEIGDNGNNGPGPRLTHIGAILRPAAIASTLRNPTAPMPSFATLQQTRRSSRTWSSSCRCSSSRVAAMTGDRRLRPDADADRGAAGTLAGAAGPGDVRPHRRHLRPDELGDDRRPAPRLAPARRRPRGARARAAARSMSPPGPATSRSSSPRRVAPGRRGGRRRLLRADARDRARQGAQAARAGASLRFEQANALALAVRRRRVRRRHGRLRRAQLLRPRPGPARDGSGRAARGPGRDARDHDPAAAAAVDVLRAVVRPRSSRRSGVSPATPDAYSYLPSSVRRFPGPEELAARMCDAGLREIRYVLTAGGIIALHVGTWSPT